MIRWKQVLLTPCAPTLTKRGPTFKQFKSPNLDMKVALELGANWLEFPWSESFASFYEAEVNRRLVVSHNCHEKIPTGTGNTARPS